MKKENKLIILILIATIVAVSAGVGIYMQTLPEEVPRIVGIYDKDGTDDWMEFSEDRTTYSWHPNEGDEGRGWDGIWTQIDDVTFNVAIVGGPPNLIFKLIDAGIQYKAVTYTRR